MGEGGWQPVRVRFDCSLRIPPYFRGCPLISPASRQWRGLTVPSRRSLDGPRGDSVRHGGVGMGGRRHGPGRGVRPLLRRETCRWAEGLSG